MAGMRGSATARGAVVVIDDDEIYRSGVERCCETIDGIDVIALSLSAVVESPALSMAPDRITALVEVTSSRQEGIDRFPGVDMLRRLRALAGEAELQVIATCRLPASRYLALRLREAGADFYYGPLHSFRSVDDLRRTITDPNEGCRLPTQWALREELGLRWDGDMGTFLSLVEPFPDHIWHEGTRQSDLGISRRAIHRLRQLAHDVAGLPPPDQRRFTGGWREPPSLPEWREVTWLVRTLRGR